MEELDTFLKVILSFNHGLALVQRGLLVIEDVVEEEEFERCELGDHNESLPRKHIGRLDKLTYQV